MLSFAIREKKEGKNNMNKKEVLELKKRFKKEECTFTKLAGCYVNAGREKVTKIHETFLNLDDDELFKYLEIAKKALSGTVGNNILTLDFPKEEEELGGRAQFLLALEKDGLNNEDLLDRFYDLVIDHYKYAGNFLILLFKDAYDVPTKTSDNIKLDESEEVFDYILCAICPVNLSKAGLGYLENEHKIGPRIRDWVVGAPDMGFIYPSFEDRGTDIHKISYYVKDPKDSHPEFIENVLGAGAKRTATEKTTAFKAIVKHAVAQDDEVCTETLMAIQGAIKEHLDEEADLPEYEKTSSALTANLMDNVLSQSGIPEETAKKIKADYLEEFDDELCLIEDLVDKRAIENYERDKEHADLNKQVVELKQELKDTKAILGEHPMSGDEIKTYDVILRVKPEKAGQIKSDRIDGKKVLIIPMEENENINLNGVNTKL